MRGLADRRQRIAQLVRERRQKFVLALIGFAQRRFGALAARNLALRRFVQARVVHGHRRLRGDADHELLRAFGEHDRLPDGRRTGRP